MLFDKYETFGISGDSLLCIVEYVLLCEGGQGCLSVQTGS